MVVTFCGHREVQEPEKVQKWLYETIAGLIREGADCFYLGGYGQFDTTTGNIYTHLDYSSKIDSANAIMGFFQEEKETEKSKEA